MNANCPDNPMTKVEVASLPLDAQCVLAQGEHDARARSSTSSAARSTCLMARKGEMRRILGGLGIVVGKRQRKRERKENSIHETTTQG
jgi:hypothetical protein